MTPTTAPPTNTIRVTGWSDCKGRPLRDDDSRLRLDAGLALGCAGISGLLVHYDNLLIQLGLLMLVMAAAGLIATAITGRNLAAGWYGAAAAVLGGSLPIAAYWGLMTLITGQSYPRWQGAVAMVPLAMMALVITSRRRTVRTTKERS